MHLNKLPTYFVKGDDRRAVYYTVIATELMAEGYVEEGEPAKVSNNPVRTPEQPVVAGGDAYEDLVDPELKSNLDEMTRAELIEWAEGKKGLRIRSNAPKAEILSACKAYEAK
jgi:hypothetical protein